MTSRGQGSSGETGVVGAVRRHASVFARIGFLAIGTVYAIVGGVALVALTGHLIEYADPYRIPSLLERVPAGSLLVWAIALGAAAYASWRLLEAASDPYDIGTGWLETGKRVGAAASGLAYGVFAWSLAHAALLPPQGARDAPERQQQHLIARVLAEPGGSWLVAAAGVTMLFVALVQFWFVFKQSYRQDVRVETASARGERVVRVLASYGYAARGVILAVLGYFFVHGALARKPSVVGDTDTAFDFIGGGVVGNTAFAIVAIGTIAYGAFMYASAWLYKFESEPGQPRSRA